MMGRRLLLVGLALFVLGGCQLAGSSPGCTAQIDWVDFVQVGSTQYVAAPGPPSTLQETDFAYEAYQPAA